VAGIRAVADARRGIADKDGNAFLMEEPMERTLDSYFIDWERYAFGFGYGSGEQHTIPALHAFMAAIPVSDSYSHTQMEAACGPVAAWLLINRFCEINLLEYGTSPRAAWLTAPGVALKTYMAKKTPEALIQLICDVEENDLLGCDPASCNCGPSGYDPGRLCPNPFYYRKPGY
jgi:hypothetical protein